MPPPIHFGSFPNELKSFLSKNNFSQIFVLVDDNTEKLCLPHLLPHLPKAKIIGFLHGELNKSLETCQAIWEFLLEERADRKSLLINLGGGVVGDMGGFCAAVYKRGMPFIQIPTTLLAQVDASVGGKLGIDLGGVKNSIGVFCEPEAVFIDSIFLQTLPHRQIVSGYAEMLKHGLIADADLFTKLSNHFPLEKPYRFSWDELIQSSVTIKKSIVDADPLEQNVRKKLNFGHTIGHAIESYSLRYDNDPLLHGEAVAIGLVAEIYLSKRKLNMSKQQFMEALFYVFRLFEDGHPFIPTDAFPEILYYIENDKKNASQTINCTLLREIGDAVCDVPITHTDIIDALMFINTGEE